jgi:multidrug efflux pump subunit AcrA (membrane-fusion protein)
LNQTTVDTKKEIQLPLSAVKFDGSDAYVFQVVDGKLSVTNIELGAIRGDRVDVVSGIEENSEIVVDARGLAAGAEVTVVTK